MRSQALNTSLPYDGYVVFEYESVAQFQTAVADPYNINVIVPNEKTFITTDDTVNILGAEKNVTSTSGIVWPVVEKGKCVLGQ